MSDVVKVVRTKGHAIVIKYDKDADSPREWSNLGKLFLRTRSVNNQECTEDEMRSARVRVPVYKYEHSGIVLKASLNGNPFSCPWDSCMAGYIVASAEDIRKEYNVKRITKKVVEKVVDVLEGEIDTYSQWIEGEVYGFEIYRVSDDVDDDCVEQEGEWVDSCWGFYSVEDAVADAIESIGSSVAEEVVAS